MSGTTMSIDEIESIDDAYVRVRTSLEGTPLFDHVVRFMKVHDLGRPGGAFSWGVKSAEIHESCDFPGATIGFISFQAIIDPRGQPYGPIPCEIDTPQTTKGHAFGVAHTPRGLPPDAYHIASSVKPFDWFRNTEPLPYVKS